MPVKVDEAWLARLRAELPELPFNRQRRFLADFQLPYTVTSVLVPELELSRYFEEAAHLGGKPQALANWIANDLLRELGAAATPLAACRVRPAHVAALVQLVDAGAISSNSAKEVFSAMFQTGEMPGAIVARLGLQQSTDAGELAQWVAAAIAANPKAIAEFKAGKEAAINAVKGAVMKASQGKANPKLVDEILRRQIQG
jgi:aspartyl-tRNA(Asn)/glutamyl-tRNA(Gln) amidotransferase subunit B